MEKTAEEKHNDYVVRSKNLRPLDKVTIALNLGLAGQALEILEGLDANEVGGRESIALGNIQMLLFLRTGRLAHAKAMNSPDAWNKVQIAAAEGNYAEAAENLDKLARQRTNQSVASLLQAMGKLTFAPGEESSAAYNLRGLSLRNLGGLVELAGFSLTTSEYLLLRGLLALEQGDIPAAERSLRQSLFVRVSGRRLAQLAVVPLGGTGPLEVTTVTAGVLFNPSQPASFHLPVVPNPLANRYLDLMVEAER
jgi:tetratricopeptide (TPR) repeat protein